MSVIVPAMTPKAFCAASRDTAISPKPSASHALRTYTAHLRKHLFCTVDLASPETQRTTDRLRAALCAEPDFVPGLESIVRFRLSQAMSTNLNNQPNTAV